MSDMNREIKIYFNDRIATLTDKDTKSSTIDNRQIHVFKSQKLLEKELTQFEKSENRYLYLVHPDIQQLLKNVIACYKYIEAAGGLVTLPDKRMLFINRLGKWDLPKGKKEKNESLEKTAIREVKEECGLHEELKIVSHLTDTYHTYEQKGNRILKCTSWFIMSYSGNDLTLSPQVEENITDAMWLPAEQLNLVMENTYESIKQVIDCYQTYLQNAHCS